MIGYGYGFIDWFGAFFDWESGIVGRLIVGGLFKGYCTCRGDGFDFINAVIVAGYEDGLDKFANFFGNFGTKIGIINLFANFNWIRKYGFYGSGSIESHGLIVFTVTEG